MEKEDIKQEIEYLEKKLTQLHKYVEKLDNNTYPTESISKQNTHEPKIYSSNKQHNNQRRKFIC
jgi:hypothetical protein